MFGWERRTSDTRRDRIDKGGIRLRVRSYMNTGCLELEVELQRDANADLNEGGRGMAISGDESTKLDQVRM